MQTVLTLKMLRLTLMKLSKNKKIFVLSSNVHGPERGRTADLLNANQALYQLSYRPEK